jgi:tight adherence protein C
MAIFSYLTLMLTIFSAVGLLLSVILPRRPRSTGQRVLEAVQGRAGGGSLATQENKILLRVLAAGSWLGARTGLAEDATLRGRFIKAGLTSAKQTNAYMTARLLGPVLALSIGSLVPSHKLMWVVSLAGTAYLLPSIVLTWMIKRRREKIRRSVPEAVDLLVICVDAGLGVDQAILRVGQELAVSHPEITGELLHINREQRAGKARLDAWKDMAKRIALPDMDAFVNMLGQTERFGTPISKALSGFSDDIRLKRRQKAEELAAKTTVKIIFPLVFFIFPSMFIVLIGPAAINIMRGLLSAKH